MRFGSRIGRVGVGTVVDAARRVRRLGRLVQRTRTQRGR